LYGTRGGLRRGGVLLSRGVTPLFISGIQDYLTALRAMRQHWSQLVWFRWLYVLFSKYMWVNEWVEVQVEGVINHGLQTSKNANFH